MDAAKEEVLKEDKKAIKEPQSGDEGSVTPSSARGSISAKPKQNKPPREIKISERPTGNQRTGILEKFDVSRKDEGEDAWTMIEADLDITTGVLQMYSNIGG